jgi:hypothetical protein
LTTGSPQASTSGGITVSTSRDYASVGVASQALGGSVVVSLFSMSDTGCPGFGSSALIVQHLITSSGVYSLFLSAMDSSLFLGPWSLIVRPSSFCISRSAVTLATLITAGQSVQFTVRCFDSYSNIRSCSTMSPQSALIQHRGGNCIISGSCIQDLSHYFTTFDSSDSHEAFFASVSVTSTSYNSVSVLSAGLSGLISTFYNGASLFGSGDRTVLNHPLNSGFNFMLQMHSRNSDFGQGVSNPFAIKFAGFFMREWESLTHRRYDNASESIKIVIGGVVLLNSPAGTGNSSQTFSLSQFAKGVWLEFFLEYSASNPGAARSNSLEISSGVFVPSRCFATFVHYGGSPFALSVLPHASNPKAWSSQGQSLLQTVFPDNTDLSKNRERSEIIRPMTLFLNPRDYFGNILPTFPDEHYFYLGSKVIGTEIPYVSEAVSLETFKIVLSVVRKKSRTQCSFFSHYCRMFRGIRQ